MATGDYLQGIGESDGWIISMLNSSRNIGSWSTSDLHMEVAIIIRHLKLRGNLHMVDTRIEVVIRRPTNKFLGTVMRS